MWVLGQDGRGGCCWQHCWKNIGLRQNLPAQDAQAWEEERRTDVSERSGVLPSVALGQSSIMRWSLGEKRGETGGTGTARGNVCMWEGERCKMEHGREVWVPASGWVLSGSNVQREVGWCVGTEEGLLVRAVGF